MKEEPLRFERIPAEESIAFARHHAIKMAERRSVRAFSTDPVAESVVLDCIRAAVTAPSGANGQPWHFVVVSDPKTKSEIRKAAEAEERAFYEHRATQAWLDALSDLGTDANKPFLEEAPYLIVIFQERVKSDHQGGTAKHYYPLESVGIATGILIGALHQAGLACLTHTPSPMKFLQKILGRPSRERPFLLLVTGYPADDAKVPCIERKALSEVLSRG